MLFIAETLKLFEIRSSEPFSRFELEGFINNGSLIFITFFLRNFQLRTEQVYWMTFLHWQGKSCFLLNNMQSSSHTRYSMHHKLSLEGGRGRGQFRVLSSHICRLICTFSNINILKAP